MRVRKQFSKVSSYNLFLGEEDLDSCSCAYIFSNSEIVEAIIAERSVIDSFSDEDFRLRVASMTAAKRFEKFIVDLLDPGIRDPSFLMDSYDIS